MKDACFIPAHPSSGTRMLGNFLNSHPQTKWFFEQINSSKPDNWYGGELREAKNHDPERILVIDLKYHSTTPQVVRWLDSLDRNKIVIIHLIRFDYLELTSSELKRTRGRKLKPVTWEEYFEKQADIHTQIYAAHLTFSRMGFPYIIQPYEEIAGWEGKSVDKMPGNVARRILNHMELPYQDLFQKELSKINERWDSKIEFQRENA